jgi:hypothetical protein
LYADLLKKYSACKGQIIHEAAKDEQLFPIITREDAITQVRDAALKAQESKDNPQSFRFGIWNFMTVQNRLLMMGVTPSNATVTLVCKQSIIDVVRLQSLVLFFNLKLLNLKLIGNHRHAASLLDVSPTINSTPIVGTRNV